MAKRIEVPPGTKFGTLTVIREAPQGVSLNLMIWFRRFVLQCACGAETIATLNNLRQGKTVRCMACQHKRQSQFIKHGHNRKGWRSPEYSVWAAMINRCENPKNNRYLDYGGRGITVCVRWHNFLLFLEDMGPRPSLQHSIDRLDVDGPYNKSNCRWATPSQQVSNRRSRAQVAQDRLVARRGL